MGKRILIHYRMALMIVVAIVLAFLYVPIRESLYFNFLHNKKIDNAVSIILVVVLLSFWLFLVAINIRKIRYSDLTGGRNYLQDRYKFKRTYFQLIEYFKDADPHKLDTSSYPTKSWRHQEGIIVGYDNARLISIPSRSESNIAVFGPPGTGKTSGVGITSALQFGGSVVAIDIKGDIYNYCKDRRNIIRFCPDNPNALTESAHFNPLAGINSMTPTEKKLYIENMAIVLVPDQGGSDGNYFSTSARKFFQGITHYMLYTNPNISFPEIIHAILQGNAIDWVKKVVASDCTEAKDFLGSFWGSSEKNISGAYDCLSTALLPLTNPILDELLDNSPVKSISIDSLEDKTDIYLQLNQENLKVYAPICSLIISSICTSFLKRPDMAINRDTRPILLLLDEAVQLTLSYEQLDSMFATMRSKNIVIMYICQNIAQIEKKYGKEAARALVGNCNYQIILGSNDISSSKIYSDTFGTRKVLKYSNSRNSRNEADGTGMFGSNNFGISTSEDREPIFYPADFGDLNEYLIFYAKGKYAKLKKINCYRD